MKVTLESTDNLPMVLRNPPMPSAAIVTILQRVMDIIDPPALPEPPKKEIGFRVKEGKTRYVVRRKTG